MTDPTREQQTISQPDNDKRAGLCDGCQDLIAEYSDKVELPRTNSLINVLRTNYLIIKIIKR